MDKSHAQAQKTRRRNAEARRAARAARAAEQERDKALVLDAMRAVLRDPDATTEQRLFAVAVLDNMTYLHAIPYGMKHPADADKLIADFAKRLETK